MNTILQWLGRFLGWIMRGCYSLVGNYGLAIILFTLISKIILLPVSVWVHQNSIKMVALMPEMNNIKTKFFGDKDRIAEEQGKLYKREKYNPLASIIPLILQIILLIGIIEVIYHPMEYLFLTPNNIVESFISLAGQLSSGINIEASSVQLAVVDLIKDPVFTPKFLELGQSLGNDAVQVAVNNVQNLNMNFLGLNLSWTPNLVHGISILVPIIAGFSAWFLSFMQNRINVLQAEQSNLSKYGMMAFSVGISLFLGYFVPAGVGLYWIFSNLFTVVQLLILNAVINPQKYVDYDAMDQSRKDLNALESLEPKSALFKRNPNKKREKQDYKRFFSVANKHVVFYSESQGFYKYFKGVIEYLTKNTNLTVHYITNDPDDSIFELAKNNKQIEPYYIGQTKLITLMMKMDASIVVMTTPDLETYHLKRSYVRDDIEYIYMHHTITSVHMTLNKGALDHFDTVFCVGQHQIDEIRETEKVYNLPAKTLVPVGYELLEDLIESYQNLPSRVDDVKQVLIGPSWQEDNIMDSCIDDILSSFSGSDYRIIIRPHPEYTKRYAGKMAAFKEKYKNSYNGELIVEDDFSSNNSVFSSDILITDWSNIGFEFSYATKKPSLYINTKMKVMNEEYEKISLTPLDISLRDIVGKSIDIDKVKNIKETADYLMNNQKQYADVINDTVNCYVFNLGKSAEVGGQYIIKQLQEKSRK